MNVRFAVQEMNVPMSQYIEWPMTLFNSAAAIGEMTSWHIKSKLFNFSVWFLYAIIL